MSRSLTVVTLATAVLLTGCSGADTGPAPAAPASAGANSGTIRFGVGFTLDDWDTFNKPNNTFISAVFEQLVELAPDGVTLQPRLATEWKQTPEQVEFTLREGVTFHDGTPFDAEAVKANLERVRDSPSQYAPIMGPVAAIEVVDPAHLVLKLKRAAPTLLPELARSGGYMLSPKTIKDKTFQKQPAGTGAWKLNPGETVQDAKVVLDAYPGYWDKSATVAKRLEIHTVSDDNAAVNALSTGQLDVISVSPAIKAQADAQGFKTLWYPALRYHFLFFDRKDVFADARVRQAVCSSLDTKALIDGQFEGLGESYDQRFDQGTPGHDPAVKAWPRDIAKAKSLLAAAGKPGLSFTFPIYNELEPMAELIRSQLGEAGITVKIEKMSVPQFFSTFDVGKFPAAYNTSNSETPGVYDYYAYRFAKKGVGNPFQAAAPELDDLAAKGLAEKDPAAQEKVWQQMTKLIHDQAYDCGFFSRPIVFAWDPKKVDNIVPTRSEPSVFRYREAKVTG
ncbi:ABC transporter substrate-binding protein [Nonomuraea typhae]|uniref:ABC transporter substrate-binding protein n=1 Tax=Nonomuraea typhae TaxID=2603600 RepID=A0ABW7Z6D6_9ACTN